MVSEAEMMALLGKGEVEDWPKFTQILRDQNLIRKTDLGDYVLVRNLDQISFWSFYRALPYPLPKLAELQNCNVERSCDRWSTRIIPYLTESNALLEQHLDIPMSQLLEEAQSNGTDNNNTPPST